MNEVCEQSNRLENEDDLLIERAPLRLSGALSPISRLGFAWPVPEIRKLAATIIAHASRAASFEVTPPVAAQGRDRSEMDIGPPGPTFLLMGPLNTRASKGA